MRLRSPTRLGPHTKPRLYFYAGWWFCTGAQGGDWSRTEFGLTWRDAYAKWNSPQGEPT